MTNGQPTVIVVPAGVGVPTVSEEKGLSTGAKILIILILFGAVALVAGYFLLGGGGRTDCTGIKKPQFCYPNTQEQKIEGTKNCCKCQIDPYGLIWSYAYECSSS